MDVRTPRTVQALVESRKDDFAAILPRHATVEQFVGLAVAYVRRDPNLKAAVAANPAAFIIALRECAALGHVPMRGTFSLVPFRAKRSDANQTGWDIAGIEEVRGTIQRMFRAGGVTSVHVELIRREDEFRWAPTRMVLPVHEFDWSADESARGDITGVYAFARLRNGGVSQVVVMNMAQVARYESVAKTDKFWKGTWRPEMIQKTALHRLEKFVPTSASYLWEIAASESGNAAAFHGLPDTPAHPAAGAHDDVIDAEEVPDPAAPADESWPEPATPGGGSHGR